MSADHGDGLLPGRHSTDGENAAAPRFDVVVRGYDRRQVDEHIAGLERTLARQRTDLDQARAAAPGTNGTSGPRTDDPSRPRSGASALFNAGTGSSRPVGTDSPGGLTPEMISAFTTRLQSILQAAEEEAEEVRTNARNFARKEEDAGRTRLAELERRRETMLGDLGRVRSQLETVLNNAGKEPAIGANLPAPPTPPDGIPMRGDKGAVRPDGAQQGKRPEQGGPRLGPLPVTDGNRQRPPAGPRPEHQNVPDGGQGRPQSRPMPKPAPQGNPVPQNSPVHQSGPQQGAPKPHPTPSPRPRTNQPASGAVSGGAAQGTREPAGRGPVDQHARNGVISRENGAPPNRGDDADGRPAFGSGAR
jgi:syndecan 1